MTQDSGATPTNGQTDPAAPITSEVTAAATAAPTATPEAEVTIPVIEEPNAPKADSAPKASPAASLVNGDFISEQTFLTAGFDHLNRGARYLEAAQKEADGLRKEYTKAAKKNRNIKLGALAGETLLMAFYGYGAIESYTGKTDMATNATVSGVVSAFRAWGQYGLMQNGETAFKEGNKLRGAMFSTLGIGLAVINVLAVAVGFAGKEVQQDHAAAVVELDKVSAAEAQIHAAKAEEVARLNAQINELDQKIHAATGDPRLPAIDAEVAELEKRNAELYNHPNFDDGRETEWDKVTRKDMDSNRARIEELSSQKQALVEAGSHATTPEQQQLIEATTKQRLELNQQIQEVDARFQPQIEAMETNRKIAQEKLDDVSLSGNGGFESLFSTEKIALEAFAAVTAIGFLNWYAATVGHKQEKFEGILSGTTEDPWIQPSKKAVAQDQNAATQDPVYFMGYNCTASRETHMRNEAKLVELIKTVANSNAMQKEMKAEIHRVHGRMVTALNERLKTASLTEAEDYEGQLTMLNEAYNKTLNLVETPDMLREIGRVLADSPDRASIAASVDDVPTFKNPADPAFQKLPKGSSFRTEDGELRFKA